MLIECLLDGESMVQTEFMGLRISKTLVELIKEYIELDTHMNVSDFVRDAIREKLKKDSPELFLKLFNIKKQEEVIFNHNGGNPKKDNEVNKPAIPKNDGKEKGGNSIRTRLEYYL